MNALDKIMLVVYASAAIWLTLVAFTISGFVLYNSAIPFPANILIIFGAGIFLCLPHTFLTGAFVYADRFVYRSL
jgi:hypothetical protein